jgi:AcrR family transcriptional regulator
MYHDEMTTPRQTDTRVNQKERTRRAIVQGALELLQEGSMPTVAAAAERAMVSRATAYRYFASQDELGEAVATATPAIAAIDQLVDELSSSDVEERLLDVVGAYNQIVIADESHMRNMLRVLQDNWLKAGLDGGENKAFVRSQTRLRWIDQVLGPLEELSEERRARLRAALAITLGIEPIVSLKDACGLGDDDALAVLRWAAVAILRAGLSEGHEVS